MPKKTTDNAKVIERLQLEMKDTLESLGCVEVVSASSRHNDIRFLCRVSDEPKWLSIVADFLSEEGSWYSFIGRKYFVREGNLLYGWALMFEADDLDKAVVDIRKLFLSISDKSTATTAVTTPAPAPTEAEVEIALPFTYPASQEQRVRPLR